MGTISLSTWSLLPKMDYQHAVRFAVGSGFEGIEFWSSPIDFWPEKVTAREIDTVRSLARDHRLTLAVHFCYGNNNLADLNDAHLNVCMEQLRETMRLCRRIGAELVVVHPGTVPDFLPFHKKDHLNPGLSLAALKKEATGRFLTSLARAAAFAEGEGVVIGLENLGYRETSLQTSHEDLANWVDQIASPSLRITLDVGHAHLEGGVEKAVQTLGTRIRHVHLDDNDGKSSNHGELGTGTVHWKGLAPFLRSFDGMLSLEVRNDDDTEGAVLRSKSFLERLIGRP